jgi:antitoxin ParD1/3/4
MARKTSVTLGDHFSKFIADQMQAGRYGSASGVVRAGLRLLEEHETKVKALQDPLVVGEHSAEPGPFNFDAFKARKRSEYKEQ